MRSIDEMKQIIRNANAGLDPLSHMKVNPKRKSVKVDVLIFAPSEDEARRIKRLYDSLHDITDTLLREDAQ